MTVDESETAPVVVKLGGARAVEPAGTLADVAHLSANGRSVVLVHGGSTAVDETLAELGDEPTYVETPEGVVGRFTDERTMDVIEMVMPGKLNTDIVTALQNGGVDAVGLSGVDGKLLEGARKSAVRAQEDGKKKIKRGDHSGTIESVNVDLLETLLAGGYVPVVSLPVLASESGGYVAVNADADRAAAAIAGALGADLVALTDVDGIYADPDDEATLIESATTPAGFEAVEAAAEGFMTKKVMAAAGALSGGASSVTVASANANDPVLTALDGGGTTITPGALGTDGSDEAAGGESSADELAGTETDESGSDGAESDATGVSSA